MLLNDAQQLQGRTAWPFSAALPLLHRRLTGVEVTGEYRLADTVLFSQGLDLVWRKLDRDRQTGRFENPQGVLVDDVSAAYVLRRRRGRSAIPKSYAFFVTLMTTENDI